VICPTEKHRKFSKMTVARRYDPPSGEEIAVGARVRAVRTEYQISRRSLAQYLSISSNQLIRIERSSVNLRLGVGWDFCELTKTNPYWLAFGEPHHRLALGHFGSIPPDDRSLLFVSRMRQLQAGERLQISREQHASVDPSGVKIKMLAGSGVKHYLSRMPSTPLTWDALKSRLKDATRATGSKSALAREFGVTRQAVSQWLSGETAPTAEATLRLLDWVERKEAQQKNRGDRVAARPPQTTRKSKSTSNEKAKPNQKKR
jgi:transcriptional regulator with XRE-family HTH domain